MSPSSSRCWPPHRVPCPTRPDCPENCWYYPHRRCHRSVAPPRPRRRRRPRPPRCHGDCCHPAAAKSGGGKKSRWNGWRVCCGAECRPVRRQSTKNEPRTRPTRSRPTRSLKGLAGRRGVNYFSDLKGGKTNCARKEERRRKNNPSPLHRRRGRRRCPRRTRPNLRRGDSRRRFH